MSFRLGIKSDAIEYRYTYRWLFELMERLDVHYLQLGSSCEMYQLPDRTFIRLRAEAEDHGVAIASCFTAHRELGGMLTDDPDLQEITRVNFRRYAEIAALVGAESVGSNAGAIFRDQMELKGEAIERYLRFLPEICEYAASLGLQAVTLEPMSSLAEPPATPAEMSRFMERLNPEHRSHGVSGSPARTPVYFCSDMSHGVADESGGVVHSNVDLFRHAIPWMWEFHYKNTDARFESTFGFGPTDRTRGIVDLTEIVAIMNRNADQFPRESPIGYLELPGPKLGRDYTDCLLGPQIEESVREIRRVLPE